jgi:hypothetical protein
MKMAYTIKEICYYGYAELPGSLFNCFLLNLFLIYCFTLLKNGTYEKDIFIDCVVCHLRKRF